jgi:hypothetical protein
VFKSFEIKPQKYSFVNDQAWDKKKNNPEYFEQFFGANHLDKGLTKISREDGRFLFFKINLLKAKAER